MFYSVWYFQLCFYLILVKCLHFSTCIVLSCLPLCRIIVINDWGHFISYGFGLCFNAIFFNNYKRPVFYALWCLSITEAVSFFNAFEFQVLILNYYCMFVNDRCNFISWGFGLRFNPLFCNNFKQPVLTRFTHQLV